MFFLIKQSSRKAYSWEIKLKALCVPVKYSSPWLQSFIFWDRVYVAQAIFDILTQLGQPSASTNPTTEIVIDPAHLTRESLSDEQNLFIRCCWSLSSEPWNEDGSSKNSQLRYTTSTKPYSECATGWRRAATPVQAKRQKSNPIGLPR